MCHLLQSSGPVKLAKIVYTRQNNRPNKTKMSINLAPLRGGANLQVFYTIIFKQN